MSRSLDVERPERRLALAHHLAELAMAAVSADRPDDVLRLALERLCDITGWPTGHAWLHDPVDDGLRASSIWAVRGPDRFGELREATARLRFASGEGLPGRVLATAEPLWISDVAADPEFRRARHVEDLGVRAAFAFPVRTADGIAAVLEFFSPEPEEIDPVLLDTAESIGGLLGRVFERVRASEALRGREERYRALAENAAEAVVSIDENDSIVFANPATSRIFGYSLEELRERPFTSLMPERYRSRHRTGLLRYHETGERRIPWNGVELPGLHRDGHEIPLEVTFGDFHQGGRHFFTGIMRDITQRKRSEEERAELLRREREARAEWERRAEEERALREAAAAVSAAFTEQEAARRIAECALAATGSDGSFVEQIDMAAGELVVLAVAGERAPKMGVRMPYRGSLTERAVEREEPQVLGLIDARGAIPESLQHVCGSCSVAIIPLLDAGSPVGALVLVRRAERRGFRADEVERAYTFGDLAGMAFRRIHLLEESERRREELQRIMDSRSRLMRGFTHDVKNPLGAAQGYLDLLLDEIHGELPEAQGHAVRRARGALDSALRLIDDLLELARAEAGDIEIRRAPTDAREAAREIAEEYRGRAEKKELTLTLELPSEFPTAESDPARVRQVLSNLMSNAVKYTPEGGGIVVAAEVREDRPGAARAIICVRDTGPGIAPEQHERLFEEFTRLDPEGSEGGAGIGLAISRRIARALGGDIEVDSEPGRGSTFSFWLPLRRAPEYPGEDERRPARATRLARSEAGSSG